MARRELALGDYRGDGLSDDDRQTHEAHVLVVSIYFITEASMGATLFKAWKYGRTGHHGKYNRGDSISAGCMPIAKKCPRIP